MSDVAIQSNSVIACWHDEELESRRMQMARGLIDGSQLKAQVDRMAYEHFELCTCLTGESGDG